MKISNKTIITALAGSAILFAGQSHAANLYYDGLPGTPDGASDGGAGPWDTFLANWDNGASYVAWNNANNDTAIFGGTADVVSLNSNVTVGGLSFTTNGYSIAPSLATTITFGAPGDINVSTGTTTITAVLAGTSKITKTGNGTLYMNAANTFSGDIDLAAGRIQVRNDANEGTMLGAAGNTLTFTANAELYNAAGTATLGQNVAINNGVTGRIGGAFGERTQINGVVSGSGTAEIRGYSAGFDVEWLNTGNTFTGNIEIRSGDSATLGVRSLVDSNATIGLQSNSNNGGTFELMGGAVGPMTFNQRQFELIVNGNSGTNLGRQARILNASSQTMTINTDLLISGTGNKNLLLDAGSTNSGDNAFNGAIIDAIGDTGGSEPVPYVLTLHKRGNGKWILGGQNTYEGNTIIDRGTLDLADSGELLFIVGDAGVNNAIVASTSTATKTLNLNGDLVFNLTNASTTLADSWNIVDVTGLNETYGGTFGVTSTLGSFTESAGIWNIQENGVGYEFEEATGVLTVVAPIPEPGSLALLGLGGLLIAGRRRRA